MNYIYCTKFIFLLILVLFTKLLLAQYDTYKGVVKLKSGVDYDYELNLSIANNVISGYSITDVKGRDETKSNISGILKEGGKYVIKENRVLTTKSSEAKSDFCFILTELTLKNNLLQGNFTGYTKDNKVCGEGEIFLKKYEIANTQRSVVQMNPSISTATINDKKLVFTLMEGEQNVDLKLNSDTVEMFVFDNGFVDGDRVDVLIDNELVLSNFELTKEKKRIQLLISQKTNVAIVAKNNGNSPPNTAFLLISTKGLPLKSYQTKLQEGQRFSVNLLPK